MAMVSLSFEIFSAAWPVLHTMPSSDPRTRTLVVDYGNKTVWLPSYSDCAILENK